uniref:Uncharacterized protein n=1 Tax=viral metagenome TaxID=1070528 RepID=A0A6M3IF56_9ZZZZ
MGTGIVTYGTDPKAKTIKVYYTESSTIYEGMPVCYEFDATTNWCGVSTIDATTTASTITESTTTAEGYQNEGKFIRVEDPDADNIHAFAGVVVNGGYCGSAGPHVVDIYIPNGAIVPVRAGVECTVGRTVLAVISATQYLGHPLSATQAKPVALAWETDATLDSTADTILAKLDPNMFIHQSITGDTVLVGTGGTAASASQVLNSIDAEFGHTGGYGTAFLVKNTFSGALAATGGGAAIVGYLKTGAAITATTGYIRSILGQLDHTGGTLNGSNLHVCGIMAQVNGNGTLTAVSKMAALMCDMSITGSGPTAGDLSFVRCANNNSQNANVKYVFDIYGGYGITNLFNLNGCSNTGEDTSYMVFAGGTGTGALSTGGAWKKIRVVIEDTDYYLVALPDPTSA